MIKKATVGALLVFVMCALLARGRWEILWNAKIAILIVMTLIASVLQPEYNPFKIRNATVDGGTALQIIWAVYLTQLLALIEAFDWNFPESFEFTPASFVFLAVAVFGLVLRSWAYLTLGRFFTWHVQVQSDQRVVTGGPYKYIRHPSYTGAFLTYVFNPFFLGSYRSALIAAVVLFFTFRRRIAYEEKAMLAELGEEYAAFAAVRKRLFPFIW